MFLQLDTRFRSKLKHEQDGRIFSFIIGCILQALTSSSDVVWCAAAIMVAKKERWRQRNVWALVRQFSEATGLLFTSPIAPIVFGDADAALEASRYMTGTTAEGSMDCLVPCYLGIILSRFYPTLAGAHPEMYLTLELQLLQS